MFNTINDSKYQKYKNKYLTQKKIVGSGKISFSNLKNSVSNLKNSVPNLKNSVSNLKNSVPDLKKSVSNLKNSVPGLKTAENTLKLSTLAANSKVREIVQDVSNENLIKTFGDRKIVGLIKKLINDNELIGSLKKHKLLNTEILDVSGNKLFDKLKETINSLE